MSLAKIKKQVFKNMSISDSIIPTNINSDIQKERQNASFNVEEFAEWWHGGVEKLKFKRFVDSYILEGTTEDPYRLQHSAHDEIYASGIKASIKVATKLKKLQEIRNPGGVDIWPAWVRGATARAVVWHSKPSTQLPTDAHNHVHTMEVVGLYLSSQLWGALPRANPFSVHFAIALDAIRKQATDEQFEMYGKRAENLEICFAFAQTELGHGTYLRGLETRADFERATDEFVMNTPTISSYKWWPGGLGQSANYAIVVANLYIDNVAKDVALFIVQLRNENTHMPLPGIDIGDIGIKMSFNASNNGYLGMKNVRIPRTNMLMRHAQVHRDGSFEKSPLTALTFFPMVIGRVVVNESSAALLSMAATIATRYSAVRRQGAINENGQERQIIDHTTQQMKLFPEIASSIAYKLTAVKLRQLFNEISLELKQGKYERVPELHAVSCCMKVLSSKDAAAGAERLRLACGGHGYLNSSGLASIYLDATAACTYEGENTVLLMTVGRYLIKMYRLAIDGKMLPPSAEYLCEALRAGESVKWTGSWTNMLKILQTTAASKLRLAFENYLDGRNDGLSESDALSNAGIGVTQAAELHARCFVASTFFEEITGPQSKNRSPHLNQVMENLLELFLLNTVDQQLSHVLRVINMSAEDLCSLQKRLENALRKIRPEAVAICDGFDWHNRNLVSTLGCYDGNVFERIFEAAKSNPLNKQPVPEVFHTHLRPFLKSKI